MNDPGGTDGPARKTARKSNGVAKARPEAAFDLWLDRELRRMYGEAAAEPVPDDLLRLIDEHAKRQDDKKR